eukprot:jgi/Galph1/3697/GphlegSOOS_G2333.1
MDANAFETLHDLYDQKFLEKKEPQQVIDFFKFLRRNHLRRPDLVLNLASYLRDASQDSLDYWEAIEEMAFRAADVSDYQTLRISVLSHRCCKHIQGKFGNSWRLQRLLGILHEVRFEYKTAAVIYEKALDSNPACFFVYKRQDGIANTSCRQVAVLRSLGKYEEAIAVLCDYLKIFKLEEESWIELVDLYLEVKRYEEAAFAASELIIMNPTCWIYFFLVAQIYYTIGDKESLVLARKYFCYCCKVQKDCPGVLYVLGSTISDFNL